MQWSNFSRRPAGGVSRYPGVFGVFLYRSANPGTLAGVGGIIPGAGGRAHREFEAGLSPEEICAKTVRALREIGADKVYLSNLGFDQVDTRYRRIHELASRSGVRPG